MSNNGIPPLNDWQEDNYPVIYDEGNETSYYVKSGVKNEIPSGGTSYLVASVILTDAQIKTLPTTFVDIVAAPGSGKIIVPMAAFAVFNKSGGVYTNVTNGSWSIVWNTGSTDSAEEASSPLIPDFSSTNIDWCDWNMPKAYVSQRGGDFSGGLETLSSVEVGSIENKALSICDRISMSFDPYTGGNAANTLKVTVYYVVVDL